MKKLTLTSLIIFLTTFVYAQEIKISVAPTINNALYYKFVAGGPGRGFKSGFNLPHRLTVAGLNAGLVFGNKDD